MKDYVKRFNQVVLKVEDPSDKVVIMTIMEGLCPGSLFDSLSKNVPKILSTLQSKADKYIVAEELVKAKQMMQGKDNHKSEVFTSPNGFHPARSSHLAHHFEDEVNLMW